MYIYIPQEILQLLVCHKECFSCITTYHYFVNYIWCLLLVQGRKTTRNMYKHCFFFKKSLSSWSRFLTEYKWDYTEIVRNSFDRLLELFEQELMIYGGLLACYDSSLFAKDSKKISGIQKWDNHSGNADAGGYIVGHHWGILGLVCRLNKRFICFIITFRLITGKINYQWKCGEKGIEPLKIWDVAHAQILQLNEWAQKRNKPIRVVVDAYFSNNPFIQPLMDKNIHVITRLRENGIAYLDPEPQPPGKRGPKPRYGKKIKVYDLMKTCEPEIITAMVYGKTEKVKIVTKEVNMLKLSKKVKVVVVQTARSKCIAFISTDLTLSAAQIIEIYGSRFSIEISIRDMKQHLGAGDYQHHDLLPVMRHLHLVATALNVAKTIFLKYGNADWLKDDNTGGTPWTSELSISRLRYNLKRHTLGNLISHKSDNSKEDEKLPMDINTIMDIAN